MWKPATQCCVLISGFLCVSLFAQIPLSDGRASDDVRGALGKIEGKNILRHIETLASDRFEGRAPGTLGEKLTVQYLTEQFKKTGLRPGNPNGTFIQTVPLIGYKTTGKIDLSVDGRPIPFVFLEDFVHVVPRPESTVTVVTSGVVFAGYGISAPQFGWDDYKNTDVRNKLVIVLSGEPGRRDKNDPEKPDNSFFKGDERTYYSSRDFKYEMARERGAAGLLVITDPESSRTFSIFKTFAGLEGMALEPHRSPKQSLAIAGLMTMQAADRIFKAAGNDFKEAEKSASSAGFRVKALSIEGTISLNSRLRNVASSNVVAKVDGSDPLLRNQYVIYSAHWDHLGVDPHLKGDQIYNGANDNAAGTAQLIEIARAFAALKTKPKRSVLFMAVTAEEKGFLGSRYYVQKPLYPISKTIAAINLDAGNLFGMTKDLASTGYGNSTMDDTLEEAAVMQGRIFLKRSFDDGGTYFASDQIEFAKAGIPAVFPWSGVDYVGKPAGFGDKVWDDYGSKRYHRVGDEVMADWEMTGAVEDARWMMTAGYLAANKVERPVWLKGSEFVWLKQN
jgi:Zn-dependent M28 family amino/carboxypeptidase